MSYNKRVYMFPLLRDWLIRACVTLAYRQVIKCTSSLNSTWNKCTKCINKMDVIVGKTAFYLTFITAVMVFF